MSVTTRRERRQQERRQQRRAAGGSGRRGLGQLWVGLGIIAALIALFLVGRAAGVFDAPAQSTVDVGSAQFDPAGQTIGEHRPDLGNAHIPTGQKGNYDALPPTSGSHYAQPAGPTPWGIKSATLPFEVTTHNLEHGGIVLVYKDLNKADLDQLTALVNRLRTSGFSKVVMMPYADLQGGKIALTSWNWILRLPGYDQTSIIKFFRAHYDSSEAPEQGVP